MQIGILSLYAPLSTAQTAADSKKPHHSHVHEKTATKLKNIASGAQGNQSKAMPPKFAQTQKTAGASKADLAHKLATTHNLAEGRRLAETLEMLRASTLQPVTRALLRAAERHLQTQTLAQARDDVNSALALQPDNSYLLRQRAQIAALAGQNEAALLDLARVIHLDGGDVQAWDLLSSVEEQKGDMMAAYKAWKHVLSLNPTQTDGTARLKQLYTKAYGQRL